MARAFTFTCDPDAFLKEYPCIKCLDKKAKLAVLALILSSICNTGTPSSANELVADAKCWACYNEDEMMTILINLLADYAIGAEFLTVGGLSDIAACINCVDNEHMLKAIILKQFCCLISNEANELV
jgi:hypothetical protein